MSADLSVPEPRGAGRPRVALIINESAGRGRGRRRIEQAVGCLRRRSLLDVVTPGSGAATETAARGLAGTHDVVVAGGGDGTVHRVLNGMAHSATPMGVVPLGTGNDFAESLGIPTDPERAAARVLDGVPVPLDLVEVNGRFYGTVGVLGVAAASALAVSHWTASPSWRGAVTRRLGGWSYRVAGLRQLIRPDAGVESLSVSIGGGEASGPRDLHAVFVTNGPVLGGGLRLPVEACYDDGQIEVCLVPRMPRATLLWAFLCFAQGWRVPAGALVVVRGTQARIEAARPLPFSADGELVCTDSGFAIAVHHHALRVLR